jgi:cytochrome b
MLPVTYSTSSLTIHSRSQRADSATRDQCPWRKLVVTMHSIRAYHAILGLVVLLAYVTSEWGSIHTWLGYGVALMILVRLGLAASGLPRLGLERFYPHFTGLDLGHITTHPAISRSILFAIAISLLTVTASGVVMDGGCTFSGAGDGKGRAADGEQGHEEGEGEGPLGEVHEAVGNLLLLLVGGHVAYLPVFKRPLARFMLFLPPADK